jgi:hypothetical protein
MNHQSHIHGAGAEVHGSFQACWSFEDSPSCDCNSQMWQNTAQGTMSHYQPSSASHGQYQCAQVENSALHQRSWKEVTHVGTSSQLQLVASGTPEPKPTVKSQLQIFLQTRTPLSTPAFDQNLFVPASGVDSPAGSVNAQGICIVRDVTQDSDSSSLDKPSFGSQQGGAAGFGAPCTSFGHRNSSRAWGSVSPFSLSIRFICYCSNDQQRLQLTCSNYANRFFISNHETLLAAGTFNKAAYFSS